MKILITIILFLCSFSVNGQTVYHGFNDNGNPISSLSVRDINYPISWDDTLKVKILIYSECHNGAICLNGYVVRWFEDRGFDYNKIEEFYNDKWEPLDNTKVFSWIRYEWKDVKKKKGIF